MPLKKNIFLCIIFSIFQGTFGPSTDQNWENLTEEIIENIPENTTTENFLENDNSIEKSIQKTMSTSTSKFPFEGLAIQSKLVPFSDE